MDNLKQILLCAVFFILLCLGFWQANIIGRFSMVSLRFDTPICGETAFRARQYGIEGDFWATFWSETPAELSAGARSVHADTILFSGDAMMVWFSRYIAGTAPSSVDSYGIAVSEALAHSLWGSTDIIGQRVYADESPRIVRGIFEGNMNLALLSFHIEDTTQNWTAAELSSNEPHPTRRDIESFATAAGLGKPAHIIMGGTLVLAYAMLLLPVLVLAVFFLVRLAMLTNSPIRYAGLILIALLLPFMLNALPPWLIPNQWSDFSFWASLLQQAAIRTREFLSINPTLRDVELRILLLRQSIIFVALTLTTSNVYNLFIRFSRQSATFNVEAHVFYSID